MISSMLSTLHQEYTGLSTDDKSKLSPKNGDVFFEMDTAKVFMYDEKGKTWREI